MNQRIFGWIKRCVFKVDKVTLTSNVFSNEYRLYGDLKCHCFPSTFSCVLSISLNPSTLKNRLFSENFWELKLLMYSAFIYFSILWPTRNSVGFRALSRSVNDSELGIKPTFSFKMRHASLLNTILFLFVVRFVNAV